MTPITLCASNNAYKSTAKVWVAKITDTDTKMGFEREFLPKTAHVTEPGFYEVVSVTSKGRTARDHYVIAVFEDELVKCPIKETTLVDLLTDGRPVEQIDIHRDADGDLTIRNAGGAIAWKGLFEGKREELLVERAKLVARIAEIDGLL